jgi:uncharacterized protein with HEPN domain
MRRKRDYTDYLRDILDAAQKAERSVTLRDMLPQKFPTT